jgi:hypothetical protein
MENLKIEKNKITWEETRTKIGSVFIYKTQILRHSDHISINKTMYVNGEFSRDNLVHIPIDLIDDIKALLPV